jgi:deoxyribonuclease V
MPTDLSILCLDVAYGQTTAVAAGVLIDSWTSHIASDTIVLRVEKAAAGYVPGALHKRELPLLAAVIAQIARPIDVIVIDGYVWLSDQGTPGLGAHLSATVANTTPIIGVAKTQFHGDTWSVPVHRGESRRPLFVTSAGIDLAIAAECIRGMHGEHRIPTVLALADRAARDGLTKAG